MAKSPQGFIVVLPGEIIEIAQDDDISWLTLFYALPKELAEKYPDALKIPRSPYEVLYEGSYGAVAKSDMLKMLVWDCYSWAAWQFFKVKDRKGNYREIPGSRSHYAGFFPLWRLSYAIIPYIRMKFEKCGLGFMFMPRKIPVDAGCRMWKSAITTLGFFLQHYSMIYKTEKRHDRNHAVSRKQYTVLLGRPSGRPFFI